MTCQNMSAPWKIVSQQVVVSSIIREWMQIAPNELPIIGHILKLHWTRGWDVIADTFFQDTCQKLISLKSYMLPHKPSQNSS